MVLAVDSQTAQEGDGRSSAGSDARAASTVSLAVPVTEVATLIMAKQTQAKLYLGVPGSKLPDGDLAKGTTVPVQALSPKAPT